MPATSVAADANTSGVANTYDIAILRLGRPTDAV